MCTPMFIAALFTIAKWRKQPMCPSVDEWINKCGITYNGILLSLRKGGNSDTCYNMDET